jgi:hypothetical protein
MHGLSHNNGAHVPNPARDLPRHCRQRSTGHAPQFGSTRPAGRPALGGTELYNRISFCTTTVTRWPAAATRRRQGCLQLGVLSAAEQAKAIRGTHGIRKRREV